MLRDHYTLQSPRELQESAQRLALRRHEDHPLVKTFTGVEEMVFCQSGILLQHSSCQVFPNSQHALLEDVTQSRKTHNNLVVVSR